ncbi:MAG: sigma-70 family RNA polymerase sigma factor [Bacteroidetes bacterium]|jgi:RNA polymerase sigma factor (sigma-70 family)|nr:sigma-70 family RNA polymerase sigma factor [Bacteroidota bacterium]MBT4400411.1 sigma-70 family RNA polymerase sigma factor [Bacteroidota bacterium]MBT4412134.1 sigma-70 family RNA polymerase sigma factor [Bacteroidota bacterium]MBT7092146.1 sigma-70 family RNA polymerase sigma factor [Bacteroidota bacterium]MBT7464175.1 sigma-70 family RNA polymerase sigma factor [Bacteroidota bacterium]
MDNLHVQKVIEGDTAKFSYFIENYKDMAFSIAFRILSNPEDAEEIVQDSFLKVYKSLKKFRQDSSFSTWFFKIVVNSSLSRLKRHKYAGYEMDLEGVSDMSIESASLAYKKLKTDDQRKYINLAMDELGPEDRLVLTLFYLNENTIEEVSEITGIKGANVKMRLHRARNKMYSILNRRLKNEVKDII